jgi:Na+/H+-dicarboxylate symporter
MGATLLFGVIITYAVRNVPSDLNESRWIAFSIYNWVFLGLTFGILSGFVLKDPDTIFVIESLQALITQFGAVCLL